MRLSGKNVMVFTIVAAIGAPACWAQDTTPAWVHEVVCPMVGPFRKTSGPPGKSLEQILEDFRPEIAEWSVLPKLDHPLRPKGIAGGLEYQEFPQGPKRDYALWEKKYGVKFQGTEDDGVAVPSSGKISTFKYGTQSKRSLWFMCHNSPRWHDFHKDSIIRAAKNPAVSLVRQDNIGSPSGVNMDNGGHCKWCLAGFKERLRKCFTPEQLKQLGVRDLSAFDAGKYLEEKVAKRDPVAALDDPLLREYVRFMYASNVRAWADEVAAAHEVRPGIAICGNQGSGRLHPYGTVLLSAVGDLIFLENSHRTYPHAPNTINYKLALAGGRHERPAWIWDFGREEYMKQVDGSKLFVAECYANGATPYYEMNNLVHSSKKGYYAIPLGAEAYDALRVYAQFAHAHKDLLTRAYRSNAEVALVYSIPSFVPKFCGALRGSSGGAPGKAQKDHFTGFARFLEKQHIPYNVEVFGDAELWPDRDLAKRLSRYSVLVLPHVEAMSLAQAGAVREFVRGGGRILVSGETAIRSERFERLDEPALSDVLKQADFGEGRVARLTDEPAQLVRARISNQSRGASQEIVLNQTEPGHVRFSAWSKAKSVRGARGSDYSIYVDVTYTDDTHLWVQVAPFRVGTHDWERSEYTIVPAKPIKSLMLHCLFRYHLGTVWFDDVFLAKEGSEENLVKNPGFEGGSATEATGWAPFLGWQKHAGGYETDTEVKHQGTRSIRCTIAPEPADAPAESAVKTAFDSAMAGLVSVIETNADKAVFINPVRLGERMVVHILNYDYDEGSDAVNPKRNIQIKLKLPKDAKGIVGKVMLASPDIEGEDQSIPYRLDNGRVEFTVPELRVWSVVHFRLASR